MYVGHDSTLVPVACISTYVCLCRYVHTYISEYTEMCICQHKNNYWSLISFTLASASLSLANTVLSMSPAVLPTMSSPPHPSVKS